MWDTSSLTRDQTCTSLDCKAESWPLDCQRSPFFFFINFSYSSLFSNYWFSLAIFITMLQWWAFGERQELPYSKAWKRCAHEWSLNFFLPAFFIRKGNKNRNSDQVLSTEKDKYLWSSMNFFQIIVSYNLLRLWLNSLAWYCWFYRGSIKHPEICWGHSTHCFWFPWSS